jgi:hypothetical protein
LLNRTFCCKTGVIKVFLNGGIGNQLFQFATATSLALDKGSQLIFVESNKEWSNRLDFLGLELHSPYSIIEMAGSLFFFQAKNKHLCLFENYYEREFSFTKIEVENTHIKLNGYFQSEKYFNAHSNQIRKFIIEGLANLGFTSQYRNVVQIRMGDMARNENVRRMHGIISESYLSKALASLAINLEEYTVVSDDFDSLRSELPEFHRLKIKRAESNSDLEDLYILSKANNLIISNSTFGWWGAWLGGGNVVAPLDWFTTEGLAVRPIIDLFPNSWKLI